MDQIVLLIESKRNLHLLAHWLEGKYPILLPGEWNELTEPFDLLIIDGPSLKRCRDAVLELKRKRSEAHLPVLLVTTKQEVSLLTSKVWHTIDDVIIAPIQKAVLHARVEVLLRARRLSLELMASKETQLEQIERSLRESEHLFRTAFEGSSIGRTLALPDGRLNRVNKALCDMLGYSEEALSSKHFSDITHPDDALASHDLVQKLLRGEKDRDRMEKRYIRADGEVVWADVSTTLHKDGQGRPVHFITDIYEVTLRKTAEDTLKEKIRELQRFNEATVGRELRMIELKKEVNDLLRKAGEQEKYRIVE